jgi:hypothetical protein
MMNDHLEYTLASHSLPPLVVSFTIESELEWFFDCREKNEKPVLAADASPSWEAIAYQTIDGWLSAIDAYDAGVLEAAYGNGPRPRGLLHRLGRLTGVVVRLASLDAGWPPEKQEQRRLEERTAKRLDEEYPGRRPRTVRRYVEPAAGLLRTAVRAYSDERGRGPSMVYPVTRVAWARLR